MRHCNKELVLQILTYWHIFFQDFQVLPLHQFSWLRGLVSVLNCVFMFVQSNNWVYFKQWNRLCHYVCIGFPVAPCPLSHASRGITGNARDAKTSCCDLGRIMSHIITIIYKDHSSLTGVVTAHQLDCARMFK